MSSSWLKKRFNHIRRLGGFGKKSKATADDDTTLKAADQQRTTGCSDDDGNQQRETAGRLTGESVELPAIREEDSVLHMVEKSVDIAQIKYDVRTKAKGDRWAVEPPKSSTQLTKSKPPPKFTSKLRQPLRDQSEGTITICLN